MRPGMLPLSLCSILEMTLGMQQDGATRGILGATAPPPPASLPVPPDEAAAAHRAQPAERGRGLPGQG